MRFQKVDQSSKDIFYKKFFNKQTFQIMIFKNVYRIIVMVVVVSLLYILESEGELLGMKLSGTLAGILGKNDNPATAAKSNSFHITSIH